MCFMSTCLRSRSHWHLLSVFHVNPKQISREVKFLSWVLPSIHVPSVTKTFVSNLNQGKFNQHKAHRDDFHRFKNIYMGKSIKIPAYAIFHDPDDTTETKKYVNVWLGLVLVASLIRICNVPSHSSQVVLPSNWKHAWWEKNRKIEVSTRKPPASVSHDRHLCC